jgi:hypothetical protein
MFHFTQFLTYGVTPPPTEVYAVNSATLNGSTQWFDAGNPPEVQIPGSMSVSIWTKPDTYNSRIFSKFLNTGDQRQWYLQGGLTGLFRGVIYSTGLGSGANSLTGNNLSVGWNHLAMVYNGSTIKLYQNGQETASLSYSSGIFNGTGKLMVGRWEAAGGYNNAAYSFPAIWDGALSPSDITELYNGGVPICTASLSSGLTADLVYAPRLCNFNGNSGDELVDQSVSGITTANVGSTPFTGTGLSVECTPPI